MTDFEASKLREIVLYILNKTGGCDLYHVFKILYFAEMKHLAKWGCSVVPDEFCALKYGPVPTHLYEAVKNMGDPRMNLAKELGEVVKYAGEDAPNILLPKREADKMYFSQSEIEALNEAIAENQSLPFGQLMKKSHDLAWEEGYRRERGSNVISPLSMAKVSGADEAILEYIEDQLHIDAALR